MPGKLYPVTIITARYSGVYEGGEWAAFHEDPETIPRDATGSDLECMDWWDGNRHRVGVGATPDEALRDLEEKLKALARGR